MQPICRQQTGDAVCPLVANRELVQNLGQLQNRINVGVLELSASATASVAGPQAMPDR